MSKFSTSRASRLLGSAAIVTAIALSAIALTDGAAQAALSITANGFGTDQWETESGQAMTTNVVGVLNGSLNITTPGFYRFTYGAPDQISAPPSTGHGDSTFTNEVYFGANRAVAEAAGRAFCNHALAGICAASAVGATFEMFLPAGLVPFHIVYNEQADGTGGLLDNDSLAQEGTANAAILDTVGPVSLSSANLGPGNIAYVGVSDQPYPADHDFQDLVFEVQVPEPATIGLLGIGLLGLMKARGRRKAR